LSDFFGPTGCSQVRLRGIAVIQTFTVKQANSLEANKQTSHD